MRGFADLRDSGMLWFLNRSVFGPRGYEFALVEKEGEVAGWTLLRMEASPAPSDKAMDQAVEELARELMARV